jgi:hypothetical protein
MSVLLCIIIMYVIYVYMIKYMLCMQVKSNTHNFEIAKTIFSATTNAHTRLIKLYKFLLQGSLDTWGHMMGYESRN